MERILSQDERIRRAEEVYARRKLQTQNRISATVNVKSSTNNKFTKKILTQFIVCLLIYISFYAIKKSPDILSQDIMYKIADILEYDINIKEVYNNINSYMKKEEEVEQEESTANQENAILVEETLSATTDNIENSEVVEETTIEDSSSMTQMQIDAEYIKSTISVVKPLEGEITSRFGIRNPTVATVPKYHTGIDIARVTGTVIISAIDGTVELVSSQGDYGNHVKITNGEISTLYAHCSNIYVKEGEQIAQGQQIGEVGATGNVTGPHLHFEIRRNNQYVDPDLILQF